MSWFRKNGPAETPPASAPIFSLGRYPRRAGELGAPLTLPDDQHYMLIGTTGSGKTSSIAIPRLLTETRRSIFAFDFKGTLAATTSRYRATVSDVKIVDPFGITGLQSAGFNPIAHLQADSELLVDNALGLADALVPIEGQHEPHWPEGGQQLLAGLIVGEVADASREERTPSFLNVHRMLCEGEESEQGPSGRSRLTKGTRYHIARLIVTGPPEVELLLGRFLRVNEETAGIRSHAITKLAFAATRSMARSLAANDLDLANLKERPTTVYVVCPPSRVSQSRGWLRAIVISALQRLYEPGRLPVLLLLDELPLLRKLQPVIDAFALSREAGVQMMAMIQSIGQLADAFGKEATDIILGNCGVVQAFAACDEATARWMSARAGDTTAVAAGYNQGESFNPGGAGHSDGLSYQQVRRPLLTPHEMMSLPKGMGLVWVSGSPQTIPFAATPYFTDPVLNARADPNPYHKPRGQAAE